jgi:hypothetical protein
MKDKLEVVLFVAFFAFAGIRLYQRYFKKNDGKPGGVKKPGSSFASSSKDDDYEPYAKK